jgi:hypothetical protein
VYTPRTDVVFMARGGGSALIPVIGSWWWCPDQPEVGNLGS